MNIKGMKQALRFYDRAYDKMDEHSEFVALSSFLNNLMYGDKPFSDEIETYGRMNRRIMGKIYYKLHCNIFYRQLFRFIMR